jgi:voltage-gated potassium channel
MVRGRSQSGYERFCAQVDGPMTVLSVLWLPVLIIPFVGHPAAGLAEALNDIDYLVWALFVVEYLVKLYLVPARGHYVRHHLLDLVVICVPFLRPLRAVRLLRLLRLLRIGTVLVDGLHRIRSILTHNGLHFVLLAVVVLVAGLAAVELSFEGRVPGSNIHDYGDALWWAVTTVTTVGYGDRYPVTAGGRGIAVVLMLVGIGLVGVVTASVASYFLQEDRATDVDPRLAAIEDRLARIELLLERVADQANGTMTLVGPAAVDGQSTLELQQSSADGTV